MWPDSVPLPEVCSAFEEVLNTNLGFFHLPPPSTFVKRVSAIVRAKRVDGIIMPIRDIKLVIHDTSEKDAQWLTQAVFASSKKAAKGYVNVDSDDLSQITILSLHRRIQETFKLEKCKLQEESLTEIKYYKALGGYVKQAVNHHLFKMRRNTKWTPEQRPVELFADQIADTHDLYQGVEIRELYEWCRTEADRRGIKMEVLLLQSEGRSTAEIAEHLGITQATVRKRKEKEINDLRQAFDQ